MSIKTQKQDLISAQSQLTIAINAIQATYANYKACMTPTDYMTPRDARLYQALTITQKNVTNTLEDILRIENETQAAQNPKLF